MNIFFHHVGRDGAKRDFRTMDILIAGAFQLAEGMLSPIYL